MLWSCVSYAARAISSAELSVLTECLHCIGDAVKTDIAVDRCHVPVVVVAQFVVVWSAQFQVTRGGRSGASFLVVAVWIAFLRAESLWFHHFHATLKTEDNSRILQRVIC